MTKADGPTDHLDTVDYWRELYRDSIQVGTEMLAKDRATIARLRDALFAFLPGTSTPPCRHCGYTSTHEPHCPYEAARHLLDETA